MSDQLSYKTFFGDKERLFKFTWPLLIELEAATGAGFGSLSQRVIDRRFHIGDVAEVIRLGLIGGGEDTQRAQALVENYVRSQPLEKNVILAIDLLTLIWTGEKPKEPEPEFEIFVHGKPVTVEEVLKGAK
jgi:hypothetical protein